MAMVIQPPIANPPLLPGVSDLSTLMRAIVDRPSDTRKFLDEWNGYLKRYEEVVASYGGAARIAALQAENESKAEQLSQSIAAADQALTSANAEAGRLVATARAGIAKRKAAQDELEEAFNNSRLEAEASHAEAEAALARTAAEIQEKTVKLDARLAEITEREKAVNLQLEKMRAAG